MPHNLTFLINVVQESEIKIVYIQWSESDAFVLSKSTIKCIDFLSEIYTKFVFFHCFRELLFVFIFM